MNFKLTYILITLTVISSIFSCEKQDFNPYPTELQGNWLVANPSYLLDYGNGITFTLSKANPTVSSAEIILEEEGTYQKFDPNGILVFGGGFLSTTGYGTWGFIEDNNKLFIDRLEYYDYDSESGNIYEVSQNNNQVSLKSTGLAADSSNRINLLLRFSPFANLGLYNGNSVINNLDPSDYDAGYKEGEYISYVIGYLRNLVNSNSQVILDVNPYSYYLNGYLDATQSIWAPTIIDNNYLQGVQDGISSNVGIAIGNSDFQKVTGKTAMLYESYELIK